MPELNSGLLFVPSLTASWWLSLSGILLNAQELLMAHGYERKIRLVKDSMLDVTDRS